MQVKDIIKKPIITEKSKTLELKGVYTVEINPNATKIDVKRAFEKTYGVTVDNVNVLVNRAKFRFMKKGSVCKRPDLVKAMVTLKKGQKLDFVNLKIKD